MEGNGILKGEAGGILEAGLERKGPKKARIPPGRSTTTIMIGLKRRSGGRGS